MGGQLFSCSSDSLPYQLLITNKLFIIKPRILKCSSQFGLQFGNVSATHNKIYHVHGTIQVAEVYLKDFYFISCIQTFIQQSNSFTQQKYIRICYFSLVALIQAQSPSCYSDDNNQPHTHILALSHPSYVYRIIL
jgi:hypothetical protein